jgi:hypothetical protein
MPDNCKKFYEIVEDNGRWIFASLNTQRLLLGSCSKVLMREAEGCAVVVRQMTSYLQMK